jgi:hypothetical protein
MKVITITGEAREPLGLRNPNSTEILSVVPAGRLFGDLNNRLEFLENPEKEI